MSYSALMSEYTPHPSYNGGQTERELDKQIVFLPCRKLRTTQKRYDVNGVTPRQRLAGQMSTLYYTKPEDCETRLATFLKVYVSIFPSHISENI